MQQTIPRKKALYALILFFAVMLALLLLSNTLNSLSLAEVEVGLPVNRPLSRRLEGKGAVEQGEADPVFLSAWLSGERIPVAQVRVRPGDAVQEGDVLFTYDLDYLQAACGTLETQLKQEELGLKRSKINPAPSADSALSIDKAEQDLSRAREQAGFDAKEKALTVQRAQEDLRLARQRADQAYQAWQQALRDGTRVESDYRRQDQDTAQQISTASAAHEEAKRLLSEAEAAYLADPGTEASLQLAKEAETQAALQLSQAQANRSAMLSAAQEDGGSQANAEALRLAYEEALDGLLTLERALEDALSAQAAQERQSEEALRTQQHALDALLQAREDTKKQQGASTSLRRIDVQLQEMKTEDSREQLLLLQALLERGGAVYAPFTGTAVEVLAKAGYAPDSALVAFIAPKGASYTMQFTLEEKAAGYFAMNDLVTIKNHDGRGGECEGKIDAIGQASEQGYKNVSVRFPADGAVLGAGAEALAIKQSEPYYCVLRPQMLRSDTSGDYVYVLREEEGAFDTKRYVERVEVRVLDRDGQGVAVEGALSGSDKVVSLSSKTLQHGDAVRLSS